MADDEMRRVLAALTLEQLAERRPDLVRSIEGHYAALALGDHGVLAQDHLDQIYADALTFEQLVRWRPDLVRRIEEEYSAMVLQDPSAVPEGVSADLDELRRSWGESSAE